MSKELEAIKILKANAILFDDGTDFGASMLEAINDLDIYLTPPTADEVCKALKDFFKKSKYHNYIDTVYYSEEGKYFYTEDENRSLVELMFDNYYIHELPPHLITLIGRFYGGEIK